MKWKKRMAYVVVFMVVTGIALGLLANRDLHRIYGGLTEVVDRSQFKPQTGSLVIKQVNLLSPEADRFLREQTVYIQDGLIVSINDKPQDWGDAITIDARGKFLIPGLVDAHVHLFKSPNDLLLYVVNGVTQIRELIGEPDHLSWKAQTKQGHLGPDMFIATPRIGSFGTLEGKFMEWSQGYVNLNHAEQAQQAVSAFHQQGYDAVKIYSQINQETYAAVSTTAHDLGMKVVGHIPWSMELADIYSMQDSVGHLEEIMNALNREFGDYDADSAADFLAFVAQRSPTVARDLAQHDVAVTTTLWLVESFIRQKTALDQVLAEVELEYENPGISEWSTTTPRGIGWLPEVNRYKWPDDWSEARRARSAVYWQTYAKACQLILQSLIAEDVSILAGTDANLPPAVPGFSLHDELVSMNRAGMSTTQVLRAATVTPAQWLNNDAGSILPGKQANLVLLNKNPLIDISHTRSIEAVIQNGQLLNRNLLDSILSAVEDANDSSRTIDISQYVN